ncbi:hypothetical protein BDD43_4843 [Mucilaginibacter gracilis]|uniref:Uncharacterized protein n=1 Tax=Mucilaginibacter gracilis TaxID=423350 RepID=A0A495J6U2_9SPHI|nr:hypothetical protein BDD43_4843 [Mucilaginibacter gracilis]
MKTTFSLLFYLKKPKNYENGLVLVCPLFANLHSFHKSLNLTAKGGHF